MKFGKTRTALNKTRRCLVGNQSARYNGGYHTNFFRRAAASHFISPVLSSPESAYTLPADRNTIRSRTVFFISQIFLNRRGETFDIILLLLLTITGKSRRTFEGVREYA